MNDDKSGGPQGDATSEGLCEACADAQGMSRNLAEDPDEGPWPAAPDFGKDDYLRLPNFGLDYLSLVDAAWWRRWTWPRLGKCPVLISIQE